MDGFQRSLAVIIGIDQYTGAGIPRLKSAVDDAQYLATLLKDQHGYTVRPLVDEAATLAGLYGTLAGLSSGPDALGADDRLLLYFAGHGMAVDSTAGPAGYLVPQDARLAAGGGLDLTSLLPMLTLYELIEKLSCRHLLLVLDCCFAGAFRWATSRDVQMQAVPLYQERYQRFVSRPSWRVLTSTGADQRAADMLEAGARCADGQPHSPFAQLLYTGLGGAADVTIGSTAEDGVITVGELYVYLDNSLRGQTPGLWPLARDGDGEYVFLVPGRQPRLPDAPPLDLASNPYRGLLSQRTSSRGRTGTRAINWT